MEPEVKEFDVILAEVLKSAQAIKYIKHYDITKTMRRNNTIIIQTNEPKKEKKPKKQKAQQQ